MSDKEDWSRIGKLAEENLDLTYDDIKGLLLALEKKQKTTLTRK